MSGFLKFGYETITLNSWLLITDTYNVLSKVIYIKFDPANLKMLDMQIVLYAISSRLTFFQIVNKPTNSTNLNCVADYVNN